MNNRVLSFLLMVCLCLTLSVSVSASDSYREQEFGELYGRLPGDVSGDGEVNARDAQLVLKFTVDKWELDEPARNAALVSSEGGEPTAEDALLILRYTVRRIEWFPRFEERPEVSDLQVGGAQALAEDPFSYTMLITSYEQYGRAVEQGLVSAGRSADFFQQQDLLFFDYIPRQTTAAITVESVVRVHGDLRISFRTREEGERNSRNLALPCCVTIDKLKQAPEYFLFQVSRQLSTVTTPATESHRIPNVTNGTVMVFEQPELSPESTPPAEVEAYFGFTSRTYNDRMKEMMGRDCKEALLSKGAFTRYTPVMLTASFGNTGCDVAITGWQKEGDRFRLDVTVNHRPGDTIEDSKLLVLWLEKEMVGETTDCWLRVTRHAGEGEQATESHFWKPFHTDAKTTAMNQVSYQTFSVVSGLRGGQEQPAVQAVYCDTYQDYVTAMDTRILAESVTDRESWYALASKEDFDRCNLVVIAYQTDRSGYELLPEGLSIRSLLGNQLYAVMTLKGERLSEDPQQILCFVWLDGLPVYETMQLVTSLQQGDSPPENITQTFVF